MIIRGGKMVKISINFIEHKIKEPLHVVNTTQK